MAFLFSEQCISDTTAELLCYSVYDQLKYQNPTYNSCQINTGISEINDASNKMVNLQIEDQRLNIEAINNIKGSFYLYDINRSLIETCIVEEEFNSICIPQTGMYIYRFISSKHENETGKIVVP